MPEEDKENEEDVVKYGLFISYYSGTGIDFAKFLKTKLKDFGINAFLDVEDVPKSIKCDTDEWRTWIDRAILNSQKFVLLMTLGFNTRSEVLHELKVAKDNKIERIHFRHSSLENADLLVKIGDEKLDLSKFQYIIFDDEPDLLRKLGTELLGRENKRAETSIFMETTQKIIGGEGAYARLKDNPVIEVVIGSSDEVLEWFPPSLENKKVVCKSPYRCKRVTPRRRFFECELATNEFFRAHTIGFFHLIAPIFYDALKNLYYIDTLTQQILEILIYSIRVMKLRKIQSSQSIYIILRNMANIEITFDVYPWHDRYHFSPESPDIELIHQFSPADAWSDIRKIFAKIYRDLCTELGIVEITDITINKRIYKILRRDRNAHTTYNLNGATMPRIEMEDFGFTEEETN